RERGTVAELREALAGAVELVDDASGVVEPSRRGLPARPSSERRLIPRPAPTAARGGDTELFAELRQMPGGELGGSAGAAALLVAPPSPRPSALSRLLAGTAAAAATAWFASSVLSPSPVVPALAVLGAALAVAVFP